MICSGRSFGQRADLDLVQNVLEHATTGFDTHRLTRGFDRHHDGDFFGGGNFVEVHMQHLAAERMMLNFLHQGEVLGLVHGEIHQNVLRSGMVDEVVEFLARPTPDSGAWSAGRKWWRECARRSRSFLTSPRPSLRSGQTRLMIQISWLKSIFGNRTNWCARPLIQTAKSPTNYCEFV